MDPKSCQKSMKACSGGVSKGDLEKGTSPGQEKLDLAAIHYTLTKSEVSKKTTFWVPCWDHLGDKIVEIRVQTSSKRISENRHHVLVILGSILGTLGLPWGTFWSVIRELFSGLVPGGLPRWISDAFWGVFGGGLGGNFEVFRMYSGSSLTRCCVVFPM